jgi:signal transduction histidine kinase
MDEKTKTRIFDPFYTTKNKGLGLGLAIVKRIVELHQGSIDCISKINRGTKFNIKLPVQEVVDDT